MPRKSGGNALPVIILLILALVLVAPNLHSTSPPQSTARYSTMVFRSTIVQAVTLTSQGVIYTSLSSVTSTSTVATLTSSTVSSSLTSSSSSVGMSQISSGSLVPTLPSAFWGANFNSGTQNEFDQSVYTTPASVTAGVSNQIYHSAGYAAYYTFPGTAPDTSPRGYPTELPPQNPAKFYVQIWVYVPSTLNGSPVNLGPWVSFGSIWLNTGGHTAGINPITLDSDSNHHMGLWMGMLPAFAGSYDSESAHLYTQQNPITWQYDTWFSIGLYGYLNPNGQSTIQLLQDGMPIITITGVMPSSSVGLNEMHFGLYANGLSGPYAVYNDDIATYALA